MSRRHIGFLFKFAHRVENFDALFHEGSDIEFFFLSHGSQDHLRKGIKILLPFAAPQIDPKACGINVSYHTCC